MQKINSNNGLFSDVNILTGEGGTRITSAWLNAIQGEIANVLAAFGIPLDPNNNSQLASLLQTSFNIPAGVAIRSINSQTPDSFGNLIMNKFIESIKNKTTTEMGKLTKFNTVEELEAKLALKAVDADSRTRKDYEKEEGSDAGNDDTAVDEAEEMVDATTVCDKDEVIDEMGTTFESKEVNDETETSEMIDKKIVDALKEEIANLSNELKSIKEAKAKTEKEARDKKIIEALRSWTKQGKIKEDKETVALWTAELEKDFDNASKLINSFSVHKIAAKMYTNENKEAGKELSIQEKMKLIRDKKAGK